MAENLREELRDLRQRVDSLEKDLLDLLDQRRWLLRAVAVIALTVFGQVVVAVIDKAF